MNEYNKLYAQAVLIKAGVRMDGDNIHNADVAYALHVLKAEKHDSLKRGVEALDMLIQTAKSVRSNAKGRGAVSKEDLAMLLKEIGLISMWTDSPVTPHELEALIEKAAPKEGEPYLKGIGKPQHVVDLKTGKQRLRKNAA